MSEKTTLKIPKKLLDKVLEKAQKRYPYKEIDNYSRAALEAFYEFIEETPTEIAEQTVEGEE